VEVKSTRGGLFSFFSSASKKELNLHEIEIEQVKDRILSMVNVKSLKNIFESINYDKKHVYPWIIFEFKDYIKQIYNIDSLSQEKYDKITDLAVCFEYVNAGTYLHKHLENAVALKKSLTLPGFLVPDKYFTNKNVILGGDFCHTKAAKLSSELGYLEIPYFLAVIEESLSKANLKLNQIKNNDNASTNDISYVAYNEIGIPLSLCLQSVLILLEKADNKHFDELNKFGYHLGLAWHLIDVLKERKAKTLAAEDLSDVYVLKLDKNQDESELIKMLRDITEANVNLAKDCLVQVFQNEEESHKFVDTLVDKFTET